MTEEFGLGAMSAVTEHDNIMELSDIFKLMGERGKETQRWKKIDRNFWDMMLHLFSDLWSNTIGSRFIVRPYGSAAEDLKSEEADDVGDVDIVVFPDSDDLLIHEEMIEYLPEHPLHVRIKGADHPVLRFRCAAGSSYVSTSAVKTSHESIFGDLTSFYTVLFQLLSSENSASVLPFVCRVKDTSMSPALQVDITLPSENRSLSVAPAGAVTPESDELQMEQREQRLNLEVNREVDELSDQKQGGRINDDQIELKGEQSPSTHKEELTSEDLAQRPGSGNEEEKTDMVQLVGLLCEHLFGKGNKEKEVAFDKPECKENKTTTEASRKNDVLAGIDYVPALKSPGWPTVAQEWIKRERKWPAPDLVSKVIREGFHLVVKPPKKGGNPDCDFRISFCHAEYLLSQEMNDIQRECYRCLKKFHRAHLSTEPKSLVTFHLKNLLLETIEETGAEMWTESDRVECVMKLLRNLLKALTERRLPHYFVRSYNLFDVDYIEDPEILGTLAGQVRRIIASPMQFANLNFEDKGASKVEENVSSNQLASSSKYPYREESQNNGATGHALATGMNEIQNKQVEASIQGNSPFSSQRYHEMKDRFLAVAKELVDLAFSNQGDCQPTSFAGFFPGNEVGGQPVAALDPLEASIVRDFKEIAMKAHFIVEDFSRTLDTYFNIVYFKLLLSTEPNQRHTMLDAISFVARCLKSVLRQRELGIERSEDILVRVFNPTDEYSLDLSDFIPAGGGAQLVDMLFGNHSPPESRPTQPDANMNDIPLD